MAKSIAEVSSCEDESTDSVDWHVAKAGVAYFRNERAYWDTEDRVEAELFATYPIMMPLYTELMSLRISSLGSSGAMRV